MEYRLEGLIAAAYTPMRADGSVWLEQVGPMVDHLERSGVGGVYICGSTGEGVSMTVAERRQVAEAYVEHAKGRLTCIVHVGHNSLQEARGLAVHAEQIGADVISAMSPSYFRPQTVSDLAASVRVIASATPSLPFYYYHIPQMTGVELDMVDFLLEAGDQIPNLAGIKYTSSHLHEFEACRRVQDGRFDMVWGLDEMLLYGLTAGTVSAIGSTYNIAGPLYTELIRAFRAGDREQAGRRQEQAVAMIRCLHRYPFHPAVKAVLTWMGVDSGPCRLPLPALSTAQRSQLRKDLDRLGVLSDQILSAPS